MAAFFMNREISTRTQSFLNYKLIAETKKLRNDTVFLFGAQYGKCWEESH